MNPKYEDIAKAVGFTRSEDECFKKLASLFAKESLHNKLPWIYTPEFVLPILVYVVKHCDFKAPLSEVALELNAYLAIRYPNDKPYQVASDGDEDRAFSTNLLGTFLRNYSHIIHHHGEHECHG